jgi:peptide/nickel transport system permease protein
VSAAVVGGEVGDTDGAAVAVATPSGWGRPAGTWLVWFGGAVTCLFVLIGAAGVFVLADPSASHLWAQQNLSLTLHPPGTPGHPLGTDGFGRDLLWRTVAGLGLSLIIGAGVTTVTVLLGAGFGSIAGYFGGRWDSRITAVADVTWSTPIFLVALLLVESFGPGLTPAILAVAAVTWAGFARIVRAQTRVVRENAYVGAARLLGVSEWRILRTHVLPNMLSTIVVSSSQYVALAIMTEAALSFLGLGAQDPTPSLGLMLSEGNADWSVSVWPVVVPGIALALVVVGLAILGDGLRDLLDPRRTR